MGILDRLLRGSVERRAEQRAIDLITEYIGGPVGEEALREGAYDPAFDFEFGQPYAGNLQEPLSALPPADRIREWTVAERRAVLTRAHFLWERNPLAKGAIRVIRGFVIGNGLSVTYRNGRVRGVIEQFRVDNRLRIQRWERQWFEQLIRDGEVFVRLFHEGEGGLSRSTATTIKPYLMEYIESAEGDRDNVVAYHLHEESGTGAPGAPYTETGGLIGIPVGEIVHAYINAVGYETRGRSEFFAILPWLRAYNEWLTNRARINRYKGFLYHLRLKGASSAQVTTKRSAFRQPPAPGSVYVSNDTEELSELGGNVGADRAYEDGRAIKNMSMIGFPLPEYMLTSGSDSNLATAKSQQLPALRGFLAYQDIYTQELWRPLYERVLAAAGLAPEDWVDEEDEKGKPTGRRIRVYEAFEVHGEPVMDEDAKNLAEALTLHAQNGWASKRTLAERAGYDWGKEQEMIDAEDQAEAAAVMQGRRLGNVPVPVMPGRNGAEEEDGTEAD